MELSEAIKILKECTNTIGVAYIPCRGKHKKIGLSTKDKIAIETVLESLEELQKEKEDLKSELLKRDATYYHIEACRKDIESIRLIRESFEKGEKLKTLINNIDYSSYLGKERIKEDIKKLEQEKQNKCCYQQEEIEMKIKSLKKLLKEE